MMKKMKKNILIACVLTGMLMISPCIAFGDARSELNDANENAAAANAAYDEAVNKQNDIQDQIDETQSQLDTLVNEQLPEAQGKFNTIARDMYVNKSMEVITVLVDLLKGKDLHEIVVGLNAYENILEWREETLMTLKDTKRQIEETEQRLTEEKNDQDKAVEEAAQKKEEALNAQEEARKKYQSESYSSIPATTKRASTSSSFWDEDSARAFIVMKESGGDYNARSASGKYIGAYQLTNSYLNGDYSPENQDRVAENYVMSRYGSWMNAANFWVNHHWY